MQALRCSTVLNPNNQQSTAWACGSLQATLRDLKQKPLEMSQMLTAFIIVCQLLTAL